MYQLGVCGFLLQPLCFDSLEQRSMSCSFFLRKQHQNGMLIVSTKLKLGSLIKDKIAKLKRCPRSVGLTQRYGKYVTCLPSRMDSRFTGVS